MKPARFPEGLSGSVWFYQEHLDLTGEDGGAVEGLLFTVANVQSRDPEEKGYAFTVTIDGQPCPVVNITLTRTADDGPDAFPPFLADLVDRGAVFCCGPSAPFDVEATRDDWTAGHRAALAALSPADKLSLARAGLMSTSDVRAIQSGQPLTVSGRLVRHRITLTGYEVHVEGRVLPDDDEVPVTQVWRSLVEALGIGGRPRPDDLDGFLDTWQALSRALQVIRLDELLPYFRAAAELPGASEAVRRAAADFETTGTTIQEGGGVDPQVETGFLIPSPGHYYEVQSVLSRKGFKRIQGHRWPYAPLTRGDTKGSAQLREDEPSREALMDPEGLALASERMFKMSEELSDADADVLDMLSSEWIQRSRGQGSRVRVCIDDLLGARGLQLKKGGQGRRGGYERAQRQQILASIARIQSVWIEITKGRRFHRSWAFVVTDAKGQRRLDGYMDVEAVSIAPGEVFEAFLRGPGRQVALLSAKALSYDPAQRKPEKRLARYFAWQWRCGAAGAAWYRRFRVRTLLAEVGTEIPKRNRSRVRQRLEAALTRLQTDEVILSWSYEELPDLPPRGWWDLWAAAVLIIQAPDVIRRHYAPLANGDAVVEPEDRPALPEKAQAAKTDDLTELRRSLQDTRKARDLTLRAAAAALGVSAPSVSRIEKGSLRPGEDLRKRIRQWVAGGS